jgi:hypothetical protein
VLATFVPLSAQEWIVTTPQGYYEASAGAERFVRWNVGGVLTPAERHAPTYHRPEQVRRALRGERLQPPEAPSASQ